MDTNSIVSQNYAAWRQALPALADELSLLAEDPAQLSDSFYRFLEFGTAGMRGVLGLGTNRMNLYTVRRATAGLARYLKKTGQAGGRVAIAYDSRQNSELFARDTACLLAAFGIQSLLYSTLHSVPQLSYTILKKGCVAGVVITASHNPPEYNGYKLYGADGGQMAEQPAREVTACIEEATDYLTLSPMAEEEAVAKGLLTYLGAEMDAAYYADVLSLVREHDAIRDYAPAFRAVYTPLFGTGRAPVTHMLSALGIRYSLVEAQAEPNGHFPGLSAPNPENPEAFSLAIRQADAEGANLILATDPDCDRLGVAVRNAAGAWQILTGNEIGCLLLEHLTSTRPLYPDSFAVKSIVSSLLADRIAAAHGVQMRQVLTGFKYIAQQIAQSVSSGEGHFLFGFEESYGFLGGTFVRDKDAAMATVLLAEAACCYARRGMSLFDALTELYKKYGFVREEVLSLTRGGQEGMAQIARAVASLRAQPIRELAGHVFAIAADYEAGVSTHLATGLTSPIRLPRSNVLSYSFPGGRLVIRPSGTEPKLKAYLAVEGKDAADARAQAGALRAAVEELLTARMQG